MNSYGNVRRVKSSIKGVKIREGERLERMLERVKVSGEGVGAESPVIFGERRDGVIAQANIRTDKFAEMIKAGEAKAGVILKMRDAKANPKPKEDKEAQGGAKAVE